MPKTVEVPAFYEVKLRNGETAFAHLDKVLANPTLQDQLVNKRQFRRTVERLRKVGFLLVVHDGGQA